EGAPVEDGGVGKELTTPTGAAILAASVDAWMTLPPLRVVASGWGAGERDLADRPNMVRVIAGTPVEAGGDGARCLVIEANVDEELTNAAPELDDCRRLAEAAGVPLKRVYAEALAAYFRR